MRLTCPCCGAAYSVEVLLADRDAREAVSTAFRLPPSLSERLLRYIALFRPAERALSWARAARLMAELEAMITAAQIERNGQCYPAPVDAWRVAIDQIIDMRDRNMLALPMKSHGYLLEILVGLHQRANDQRAARQEVAEEHARAREGARTGGMQGAAALVQTVAAQAGVASAAQAEKPIPEPRAPRVPPPSMFRDLAERLKGKQETGETT
ncbi:MAG: hypothetical protein KDJ54_19565 [Candidatus Competibacteraceae bacterium]|nr:hypothetical protein [Candidatus Competibacteraceae bacterium]